MKKYLKKSLEAIVPYKPARNTSKEGVLLDANENYTQWVKVDWQKIGELNRYGESSCEELRDTLSKKYIKGFSKENIFIGTGSNEIIELLIKAFVEPNEAIGIIEPTYSFYEAQARLAEVGCKKIVFTGDFQLTIPKIKDSLGDVKILFLCSPNNPTGTILRKEELQEIFSFYSGLIVIDEAYIEYAGMEKSLLPLVKQKNVIIIRSFSKAWGLAGIRVGYAVASKEIIADLLKIKKPYNVSRISQLIALQALEQLPNLQKSIQNTQILKQQLVDGLSKLPLEIIPTQANYVLIRTKKAKRVHEQLLRRAIHVRDRSSLPLLENTLRITVGSMSENEKLLSVLTSML